MVKRIIQPRRSRMMQARRSVCVIRRRADSNFLNISQIHNVHRFYGIHKHIIYYDKSKEGIKWFQLNSSITIFYQHCFLRNIYHYITRDICMKESIYTILSFLIIEIVNCCTCYINNTYAPIYTLNLALTVSPKVGICVDQG